MIRTQMAPSGPVVKSHGPDKGVGMSKKVNWPAPLLMTEPEDAAGAARTPAAQRAPVAKVWTDDGIVAEKKNQKERFKSQIGGGKVTAMYTLPAP